MVCVKVNIIYRRDIIANTYFYQICYVPFFLDDSLSNKEPAIVIKKTTEMKRVDYGDVSYSSTSRHKDSEANLEELVLMSSLESQT